MRPHLVVAAAVALGFATTGQLTAQNLVPNGDFALGTVGWSLSQFNDAQGTTGVRPGFVDGQHTSDALYADFVTLVPVMSATWVSVPMTLPAGTLPVGFEAMWNKGSTAPIPYPSVNRIDLTVRNAAGAVVWAGALGVPGQTGYQERARLDTTMEIATSGPCTFEVVLRHSNLAGIPFSAWIDNLVVGLPVAIGFGHGCAGSGGVVPTIGCVQVPRVGSRDFRIELRRARVPALAVLAMDLTQSQAQGVALPWALGGGCELLVGTSCLIPRTVSGAIGNGTASLTLSIPSVPSLAGQTVFAQWAVVDAAAANPYGLALTGGLEFIVQ